VTGCGTLFIGGPLQRELGSLTRNVLDWVVMAPRSMAPVAVTTLVYYSTEARPPQLLARGRRQWFSRQPQNNIWQATVLNRRAGMA
jgi:hypothetical protein